jgi:hypothetical protein
LTSLRLRPALFIVLFFLLSSGCGEEPVEKTVTPPRLPVLDLEKERLPSPPPLIDSIGRLVEGQLEIDGFPFPRMAEEVTEDGASSRSFKIPALQRALLEFYMHRDFHVIKLPTGHRVKHSSISRDRTRDDKKGFGALFITERGQRNQFVRFIPQTPPLIHLPKVNKEVLEEAGDTWTQEQKTAVEAVVEPVANKPAKKPRRRVVVPFNPSLPRTMGTQNTNKKVKTWLKDNPGKVFYD